MQAIRDVMALLGVFILRKPFAVLIGTLHWSALREVIGAVIKTCGKPGCRSFHAVVGAPPN